MTIWLALFMFQGFWNVAAAFCTHESAATNITHTHFGHHLPEDALWNTSASNLHSNEVKMVAVKAKFTAQIPLQTKVQNTAHSQVFSNATDLDHQAQQTLSDAEQAQNSQDQKNSDTAIDHHHHHAPSCVHVMLFAAAPWFTLAAQHKLQSLQHFDWSNAYQSPFLFQLTPPPLLTPLQVG